MPKKIDESNDIDRNLSLTAKVVTTLANKIIPNSNVDGARERFAHLSDEQAQQLQLIEEQAISRFVGVLDELEAALGMLRVGYHVGWKVLYLVHSKKTIRKYEDILGIKIRDIFPETGPISYRSVGLGLSEKFSNFWKFVSGDIKLTQEEKENRRKFE